MIEYIGRNVYDGKLLTEKMLLSLDKRRTCFTTKNKRLFKTF